MSIVETVKDAESCCENLEVGGVSCGVAHERCEHSYYSELVERSLVDAKADVVSFCSTLQSQSSDELWSSVDDLLASVNVAEMVNADLQKIAFYFKIGIIANELKGKCSGDWTAIKKDLSKKINRRESALEKYMLIAKFEDGLNYFYLGIDGLYAIGCISKLLKRCFKNTVGFNVIKSILDEYDFVIDGSGSILSKRDFKEKLLLKMCMDHGFELIADYQKNIIDSKEFSTIIYNLNKDQIPGGFSDAIRKLNRKNDMKDTQDSASEAPQAEPCTVELFKKNAMEIKEAAEHIDFQTDAEKECAKDTIRLLKSTIKVIESKI